MGMAMQRANLDGDLFLEEQSFRCIPSFYGRIGSIEQFL
jgi:hypothetical protein